MEKKRILVIDDEADFCKIVKINLESNGGIDVITALDGDEGIMLARKQRPALIILDIVMPKMSGFDVLRALKNDGATIDIPVVILTAKQDVEYRTKAAQLFAVEYLTKPIDPHDLERKIRGILERLR